MRSAAAMLAFTVVVLSLTGCLGARGPDDATGAGSIDHDAIAATIGEPIEVFHDHTDATLHTGAHNLALVSWNTLDVEVGENGFANFVFYEDDDEDLAFIAIDGDTRGGFTIADVNDPDNVRALGSYRVGGSGFQEVRVTPDGRYALLNVQELPSAQTGTDCGVCIHIVDVTDRTRPELAGLAPVELIGTHNLAVHEIDDELYVFYVGQPLYRPTPVGSNPPPGNQINIARFVEGPQGATLVRVGEYRYADAYTDPSRSFPHDIWVDKHPLTDQHILYASWWDGGAITVDVTNPLRPQELDVTRDPAPSEALAIHWFAPEPRPRGDRLYAWSAPEIGELDSGSGVIRGYDVTDPADVAQVGTWELPGDVIIPGAFLMSPHITVPDMETGLLAVSHYHAGVWVLDITDPTQPRHVAYYQPHGEHDDPYTGPIWWKKPNFDPAGYVPNVYQAKWKDGLLWVSERGTGLYALRYTGPVPGPLR